MCRKKIWPIECEVRYLARKWSFEVAMLRLGQKQKKKTKIKEKHKHRHVPHAVSKHFILQRFTSNPFNPFKFITDFIKIQ